MNEKENIEYAPAQDARLPGISPQRVQEPFAPDRLPRASGLGQLSKGRNSNRYGI